MQGDQPDGSTPLNVPNRWYRGLFRGSAGRWNTRQQDLFELGLLRGSHRARVMLVILLIGRIRICIFA